MKHTLSTSDIVSATFGLVVLAAGLLNLFLIHPVPGVVYLIISSFYFPFVNHMLRKRFGISVTPVARVVLGIAITWFTLGISDLGDMLD